MSDDYPHATAAAALCRLAPVVPVMVVSSAQDAIAQARALLAGGLKALEVTLRTPSALDGIRAIRDALPDAMVGAGTVTRPALVEAAVAAGARFLVTPGATDELARALRDAPVPSLPGCATASEAMALAARGFRMLKFFPAEPAGGPKYLAALAGPLADLTFCPTGGIDAARAPAWLALPNVPCVGGSWMLPKDALAAGDFARIERLAREAAALRAG
ncbi:MAG: bifunctional 4-hydroxy-2-oxoglutarate aldolase/2-dehydro-3-deoxy-phosphogluconate aldolase [Hyphomicrobiales bacterium]|nr:bifunctional 4-hydroxy-2-oxoglutarate aldolase/2-dehydro-3-deoxy-phosphogluconate aldolase [Hyphomicrobiales bacterium]